MFLLEYVIFDDCAHEVETAADLHDYFFTIGNPAALVNFGPFGLESIVEVSQIQILNDAFLADTEAEFRVYDAKLLEENHKLVSLYLHTEVLSFGVLLD